MVARRRPRRPPRRPGHAEPGLSARDALGRPSRDPVAAPANRVRLCAPGAGAIPGRLVRAVRPARGVAQRLAAGVPSGGRSDGSAGRDRGGRLWLAILPGHRALAHAARPLTPVRDGMRGAAAARTAPLAGVTLFQHRAEEERGPGAPLTVAGRDPATRRPPGC